MPDINDGEFKGTTKARLDNIEASLKEIHKDVKVLLAWKYMVMGGAAAIAGLTSFLINSIMH